MSEATSGTLARCPPHIAALMRATWSLIACGTPVGIDVMKGAVNAVTVAWTASASDNEFRQ